MSTASQSRVEELNIQVSVTGPYANASVPTLNLKLEFSSLTERKFWILPFVCEIFLAKQPPDLYLGNAIAYQEGSSASRLQDAFVYMRERSRTDLDVRLELGFQKLNVIEAIRRKLNERNLYLKMGIYGWIQTDKGELKTVATRIDQIKVPESDWTKWLNEWGKETRLIPITGPALARFEDLKKSWKVEDDSELVALMVDELRQTSIKKEIGFVCTLPQVRSIQEKVKDVLGRASDVPEIMATGWVDQMVVPDLLNLAQRGISIRLILPAGETKQPSTDVSDALKHLSGGKIEIRKNDMLHGRVLISGDREAIIASSDLKTDSLVQNREAGIYTTDPVVVRHVMDFFNEVWKERT